MKKGGEKICGHCRYYNENPDEIKNGWCNHPNQVADKECNYYQSCNLFSKERSLE